MLSEPKRPVMNDQGLNSFLNVFHKHLKSYVRTKLFKKHFGSHNSMALLSDFIRHKMTNPLILS